MNKVILIGNLTRDPELEETRSGISYAKLSIAVNRNYTTEDGDRITDFFDFTVWREREPKIVAVTSKRVARWRSSEALKIALGKTMTGINAK